MKSADCWEAIFNDLRDRDDIWDVVWDDNKEDTTVEISHYEPFTEVGRTGGGFVFVGQGKRPVYDESTRKPRWDSKEQLRELFIEAWAKDSKPWTRTFRRKKDGFIVRRFSILSGPTFIDFCVLLYEDPTTKKLTKIEYWHKSQYKKLEPKGKSFYDGTWFPPGKPMFETVF
jgi:hypothetical protein